MCDGASGSDVPSLAGLVDLKTGVRESAVIGPLVAGL
jgi:hypothetical protein